MSNILPEVLIKEMMTVAGPEGDSWKISNGVDRYLDSHDKELPDVIFNAIVRVSDSVEIAMKIAATHMKSATSADIIELTKLLLSERSK